MRTKRWVAVAAAGILFFAGTPLAAAADDADDCTDAGLISSLLGKCGLLGAVLGGSDEHGGNDEPSPEPAEPADQGGSGSTSGETGGTPDEPGGTSSSSGGSGSGGSSSPPGPAGDSAGTTDRTSTSNGESTTTGPESSPADAMPGSPQGDSVGSSAMPAAAADGTATSAESTTERADVAAAQVVGSLEPIPKTGGDPGEEPTSAVHFAALALVAVVGIAITVLLMARRRPVRAGR